MVPNLLEPAYLQVPNILEPVFLQVPNLLEPFHLMVPNLLEPVYLQVPKSIDLREERLEEGLSVLLLLVLGVAVFIHVRVINPGKR